ncbi:hypothetical protein Tco_1062122 [Tanacetum coccineum]
MAPPMAEPFSVEVCLKPSSTAIINDVKFIVERETIDDYTKKSCKYRRLFLPTMLDPDTVFGSEIPSYGKIRNSSSFAEILPVESSGSVSVQLMVKHQDNGIFKEPGS